MDISLAAPSPSVYSLFIDNQWQEENEDNDSELSSATHWETRLDLQVNNALHKLTDERTDTPLYKEMLIRI